MAEEECIPCDSQKGFLEIIKEDEARDEALDKKIDECCYELGRRIDANMANAMGGLFKGPYVSGTAYNTNETVLLDGVMYTSKIDNNTTVPPSTMWHVALQYDYGYYDGK